MLCNSTYKMSIGYIKKKYSRQRDPSPSDKFSRAVAAPEWDQRTIQLGGISAMCSLCGRIHEGIITHRTHSGESKYGALKFYISLLFAADQLAVFQLQTAKFSQLHAVQRHQSKATDSSTLYRLSPVKHFVLHTLQGSATSRKEINMTNSASPSLHQMILSDPTFPLAVTHFTVSGNPNPANHATTSSFSLVLNSSVKF